MKHAQFFALLFVLPLTLVAAPDQPQSAQRFASVYQITGSVVATDRNGQDKRELKAGDVLYVGERVTASASGEAVLRTDDAGVIAVRPNAAFVMDQFVANGNTQDALSVRILTGALRMITGWTGHYNKQKHRIVTPTATVGIRGTDHETYVLSSDMALGAQMPQGTYNKVNSGGTVIDTNGVELEVKVGQVGYAPADPEMSLSALSTVLMPSLLEKVPGFFVPGAFDSGLEAVAARDMAAAVQAGKVVAAAPTATSQAPSPKGAGSAAALGAEGPQSPTPPPVPSPEPGKCQPIAIGTQWLKELDTALGRGDASTFVDKFDAQAKVVARVRDGAGKTVEISFNREELAKSTFSALAQLSGYASRRPLISASFAETSSASRCDRIKVESIVIESGMRNGNSYRTEALENYTLHRRNGQWLAVQATTSMR